MAKDVIPAAALPPHDRIKPVLNLPVIALAGWLHPARAADPMPEANRTQPVGQTPHYPALSARILLERIPLSATRAQTLMKTMTPFGISIIASPANGE
jgi:hypothetical protein